MVWLGCKETFDVVRCLRMENMLGMPAALLYLPIAAMTWRRPVPPPRTAVSLLVFPREVGKGLKPATFELLG